MPKRAITAEDLLDFITVGGPQIHPERDLILFTQSKIAKNKPVSQICTVDEKGLVKQWTSHEKSSSGGKWLPDGSGFVFQSARSGSKTQLYWMSLEGGEPLALTDLPEGSIGEYQISPDGKKVAFTFRETAKEWTEDAAKEREKEGLSTPPRVIDDLWYRLDGDGYFLGQRHHLYLLDIASKKSKLLYSGSTMGWYSFDWHPSSEEIVVAHSIHKQPFREKPNEQIFIVKLNGKATQLPGVQKGTKSSLKVSPDGKWIAFLGDVSEEDPWGVHNNHLWVVGIGGGESQCLSKSDDYCLSVSAISDTKEAAFDGSCMWSQDSKQVYVQLGWHGEVQLGVATVGKTKLEPLTKGLHVLGFGTINKAGSKMACSYSSATKLSEIGWITLGKSNEIKVLSELNKAVLSKLDVLEPEEIWLDSSDGVKLHAWVIKPRDFQNKKKYPAVLQVHGGPHTQYGWTFFHEFQVLAAAGYFVFYSNPRGSKGYGERFCAAIKNSWGDKDWEDIQTITRYMQHHPNVRAGEMGVMGGSYGGYMTNWVIGHTKDFKTAITDRCVSNLVSMAGNSDFPSNKDEYFGGCAWGDHERIKDLWRQSPLAYFEGVTTPTLVIHSEGDLRCNVEQGEQVFSALQLQGVESRFVRYPQSTFHGLSRSGPPDLRIHRLHEILTWWKNHLKGGG